MTNATWLSIGALLLAACGGGGGSSGNTVTGTVAGIGIPSVGEAKAVIQANVNCSGIADLGAVIDIDIANTTGICNELTTGVTPQSTTDLDLTIVTPYSGTGTQPAPPVLAAGTYNIGTTAPNAAGYSITVTAQLLQQDAMCNPVPPSPYAATTGTIVITAVSASSVSGTFNLTFSGGGLTGTFSAQDCGETVAQACALIDGHTTCST